MNTKIKLEIKLKNELDISDDGQLITNYILMMSVLDKDERFDAGYNVGLSLIHDSSNNFVIKSMSDNKKGGILNNGLVLPSMDRIGIEYNKVFTSDESRKRFLKKLYLTLDEWANHWWGFCYDSNSYIIVNDNMWEVVCREAYNGTIECLRDYQNFY